MSYKKVIRTLYLGNRQFQSSFFNPDEKLSLAVFVKGSTRSKSAFCSAVIWLD